MTYKELFEILRKLPEENLEQDITLHDLSCNEIVGGLSCYISGEEEDRLDKGHLVLTLHE